MLAELSRPTTYTEIGNSDGWICASCGSVRAAHSGSTHEFVRSTCKFAAMLRIKNEARWIGEVLESILPLCDRIFVMDDNSTDDTVAICESYGVTVFRSPFQGMNESRDKNWLYDQIVSQVEAEWIVCIDGDEVMEKLGPEIIRETCEGSERNSFSLQIAFMWNDLHSVRTDRIYGDFWRPSLFRPYKEDPNVPDTRKMLSEFRFMATPFGRTVGNDQPNLHCSSVPQRFIHGRGLCPARLKHYGYVAREDRVRKLDFYTSIDWKNAAEDCYRHMCQGDTPRLEELPRIQQRMREGHLNDSDIRFITDVPADGRFVHAGPLKVEPWDEMKPWPVTDWARQQHA